jgi:hypothetical protein
VTVVVNISSIVRPGYAYPRISGKKDTAKIGTEQGKNPYHGFLINAPTQITCTCITGRIGTGAVSMPLPLLGNIMLDITEKIEYCFT